MRQRKSRAFFNKTAEQFGAAPERLPWCLRGEIGERTGRRHNHALLTKLPATALSLQTCFWLMHIWEKGVPGGIARARRYEPALDGVGYALKDLSGPDAYESSKFGAVTANLTLSARLWRVLHSLARGRDRRLAQLQQQLTW